MIFLSVIRYNVEELCCKLLNNVKANKQIISARAGAALHSMNLHTSTHKKADNCTHNGRVYKSEIGLYTGTSHFMTAQAIKYATAQIANIIV